MRKWLSIPFILIVLAGAIGVPFYQHACLHDNTVIHTVFVPSSHCDEMDAVESVPNCCQEDVVEVNAGHESMNDDCCVDQINHWRFSCFDSYKSQWTSIVAVAERFSHPQIVWGSGTPQEVENVRLGSCPDPPPLSVLERLSTQCIWRL
jgi:hypothetical protein